MFNVGDRVIYESQGVYKVKTITTSPVDKTDDGLFYVLVPVYEPECNVIITPVENTRVRAIITKERAEEIIKNIPNLSPLEIENERGRRDVYKTALGGTDLEDYVRLIKTVRIRREEFAKGKKRVSDTDADFEERAKHGLYSEFAEVYDIPISEVEKMIMDKIANAV